MMSRYHLSLPLFIGFCALSLYIVYTHFDLDLLSSPLVYLNYFTQNSPAQSEADMSPLTTATTTTIPQSGWHARALESLHPDPHSFAPVREALTLALLRNSQVEPNGFSLAVFSDDESHVVVDALGRVMPLPSSSRDVNGLVSLGRETRDLPGTGSFRNTWFVSHEITGQPIDRFFIAVENRREGLGMESKLKETSVSGYSKTRTQLVKEVDGYTRLPEVLQELFGLVLEAREGYEERRGGGDGDMVVLAKVREVLKDLL
ncbi:hypothetical protein AX17_005320 [Amanita inopinata Kibby_2008]|nr:hypothetical protein AX17_005320 [Amanita inopinata Kibby_2008]